MVEEIVVPLPSALIIVRIGTWEVGTSLGGDSTQIKLTTSRITQRIAKNFTFNKLYREVLNLE
jgi:hypothetical protein